MIPYILEAEFFLRIVLASVCGILIGFERSKRLKEAGVRTHCMVACGAALMMIVSKYGFADLVQEAGVYLYGTKGADASRIASQVVSGVGFLGAGVISAPGFHQGPDHRCGFVDHVCRGAGTRGGYVYHRITGTLLIVLEQFLMHRFHFGNDAYTMQEIKVRFRDSLEFRDYLFRLLQERGGSICNCAVNKTGDGDVAYTLTVRVKEPISAQELPGADGPA